MTKKMKRWLVSKWWLDIYEGEEPIAVYKNNTDSHGWWPDGVLEEFFDKQEAEAFFKAQSKTLEANAKGCEIAVLTEEVYEFDEEHELETNEEYKDIEFSLGK